jgi:hypothetical protein
MMSVLDHHTLRNYGKLKHFRVIPLRDWKLKDHLIASKCAGCRLFGCYVPVALSNVIDAAVPLQTVKRKFDYLSKSYHVVAAAPNQMVKAGLRRAWPGDSGVEIRWRHDSEHPTEMCSVNELLAALVVLDSGLRFQVIIMMMPDGHAGSATSRPLPGAEAQAQ